MNRMHRKAIILNDLIGLHISYFKQAFNLRYVGKHSRELNLYAIDFSTGNRILQASILVSINIDINNDDYADFHFNYKGKLVKQRVDLIIKGDNLKRGNLFFFKCPTTGMQKRKLFFYEGRFVGKQAIESAYYESELQSKKQRRLNRELRKINKAHNSVKKNERKRNQQYYAGEPTKRYIRTLMASEDLKEGW
jgi:hypothetical protein